MSHTNYCKLMDEFCSRYALKNASQLYEQAALKVGGIEFFLGHGGSANTDGMLVCCKYGTAPIALLPMVMARLLQANLKLFAPGDMRFGLTPLEHEVVLTGIVPMAHLDAAALMQLLEHLAEAAHAWRKSYFLLSPMENRPAEPFLTIAEDEQAA
ncbi:MAG: CesT family type III secretion system chaperone [Pseudomonadota bacterium]